MARLFNDASSQTLSVGSLIATAFPLTVACWFRSDDTGANQTLWSMGDVSTSSIYDWIRLAAMGGVSGDPIRAQIQPTAGGPVSDTTTGFAADTWHHAIGVYTASEARSYIDGGSEGTDAHSYPFPDTAEIDTTTVGSLGRGSSTIHYMSGRIAELAAWSLDMGAADRAALAAGVSPLLVRPESLLMYLPLIRDNDFDLIGGLSFTANNAPTIAEHYPGIIYPSGPVLMGVPDAGGGGGGATIPFQRYYQESA